MTVFDPRTSGVRSARSANWATIIKQWRTSLFLNFNIQNKIMLSAFSLNIQENLHLVTLWQIAVFKVVVNVAFPVAQVSSDLRIGLSWFGSLFEDNLYVFGVVL